MTRRDVLGSDAQFSRETSLAMRSILSDGPSPARWTAVGAPRVALGQFPLLLTPVKEDGLTQSKSRGDFDRATDGRQYAQTHGARRLIAAAVDPKTGGWSASASPQRQGVGERLDRRGQAVNKAAVAGLTSATPRCFSIWRGGWARNLDSSPIQSGGVIGSPMAIGL